MKLFFTITKKRLGIILALIVIFFITAMWTSSLELSSLEGSTHAERIAYIKSLDVNVDEENFTSKETVIPEKFTEVYKSYNEIQKKGGFDLSEFKGKAVTVYSYPVTNTEKRITLLVCDGKIIGGDIAEIKIDGKMEPLGK